MTHPLSESGSTTTSSRQLFRQLPRFRVPALLWLGVLALLLLPLSGYIQAQRSGTNLAGLVVSFGGGRVETACVDLGADGEATGDEVLQDSGLDVQTSSSTGGNVAVCKIEDEGCEQPGATCFCQCTGGGGCTYWAYFHLVNGDWEYENRSPSNHTVNPGDVEGWSWGAGEIRISGTEPPVRTFEDICGNQLESPTATDVPPEPTEASPQQQPARPAPSRTPTRTPAPSATRASRPENDAPDTRLPTANPTATPDPNANLLTCIPGTVTLIEGTGPPNTALLLFFGGRSVGGGTSDATGQYGIPLTVGSERPGDYLVQVKTRIHRLLVRELTCLVPVPTPTQEPYISTAP
jgi:hypothetical protein